MDQARDVAENGQQDIDPEGNADTDLEEDAQWRDKDG